MPNNVRVPWRTVASFSLALFLLLSFSPLALASSPVQSASHPAAKKYYLALGDSLAFGFQINGDFWHGYVDDLNRDLTREDSYYPVANMACNGETSVTMINGQCPYKQLHKYPYTGAQLEAAIDYLHAHAGHMGLVTLDMGANDVDGDINPRTCQTNQKQFMLHLTTLDKNLTQIILPQIHAALMVHGKQIGQFIMMNYYDPFQNLCPNTVHYAQILNAHLAKDFAKYGTIVDTFSRFGGPHAPNEDLCDYTWMCFKYWDIHCTRWGYAVVADLFEDAIRQQNQPAKTHIS